MVYRWYKYGDISAYWCKLINPITMVFIGDISSYCNGIITHLYLGGTTLYWISPANMVMDKESLGVIRSNRNTVTIPMTYICLMHQPAWWTCHDQLVFTPQTTSLGWPIPIHWIQPWLSHDLWWSTLMGSYGWYIFAQPSKYCLCQFGRVFIIINLLGGFHGGKPQLINYKVRPPIISWFINL